MDKSFYIGRIAIIKQEMQQIDEWLDWATERDYIAQADIDEKEQEYQKLWDKLLEYEALRDE